MADPIASPFDGLQGLLDKIIGSKTVGTDQQSLTTQQQLQNLISAITTQNQNTTGTSQQNTQQNTTGQVSGSTNNVSTTNADVSQLQKVFQQQQAGVTPEMLASIFREGAKAVPGLVATTANAVGARPSGNSALATSLADLNNNLVNSAASLNTKMLGDSANTAAQIANLTKSVTDTGQTGQTTQQGTVGNNTTNTNQNLTGTTNQSTSQNQTQNSEQQKRDDNTSLVGINTKQTGIAAGLAGLVSLLKNSGIDSNTIGNIAKQFGGLFGSGTDQSGGNTTGGLFNPYDPTTGLPDMSLPPGVGDYGGNPYTNPSPPDTSGSNWWDNVPGFADGGLIPATGLKLTDAPKPPTIRDITALVGGGSNGNVGGGVDLSGLLAGITGTGGANGNGSKSTIEPLPQDGGNGVGASSGTGIGTGIGGISMSAPSIGQIGQVGLAALMGNVPAALAAIANIAMHNISLDNSVPAEDPEAAISNATATEGISGVSDNAASAPDSDAGPGDSGADSGTAGDGGGTSGGAGDGSGGDGGGGGWADGGSIPYRPNDPNGIMDKMLIHVSGGEYMLPKDVVDVITPKVLDSLVAMYHTPAATQKMEDDEVMEQGIHAETPI